MLGMPPCGMASFRPPPLAGHIQGIPALCRLVHSHSGCHPRDSGVPAKRATHATQRGTYKQEAKREVPPQSGGTLILTAAVVRDYPSRVVISLMEEAMMAIRPMAPKRLCHQRLRRSPISEDLLAMMNSRTPSMGAMSTVSDWAMTIRPTWHSSATTTHRFHPGSPLP